VRSEEDSPHAKACASACCSFWIRKVLVRRITIWGFRTALNRQRAHDSIEVEDSALQQHDGWVVSTEFRIVNPKRTKFYVASFTFSGEAVGGMTFAYTGFRCSPTGHRKGDQQVGLCARSASVDERWLNSTVADASSSFVFGVRPRAQARGSFAHDEEGRFSQRLPRTQ
jgi:hypothetical protein